MKLRLIFLWSLLFLVLPAHGQSLTWTGTANLGFVQIGSSASQILTLTNSTSSAVPVDLMIRAMQPGVPLSELAIFTTPTGSPTIPAHGSVPVTLTFTPTEGSSLTALVTARDVSGNLYDLTVNATGMPRPPTNLQITTSQ